MTAREAYRAARVALEEVRERHAAAERRRAQIVARLAALEEAKSRLAVDRDEFRRRRDEAEAALAGTDISQALAADLDRRRGRRVKRAPRRAKRARRSMRSSARRNRVRCGAKRSPAMPRPGTHGASARFDADRRARSAPQRSGRRAGDARRGARQFPGAAPRADVAKARCRGARQAAADALAAGETALADADRQAARRARSDERRARSAGAQRGAARGRARAPGAAPACHHDRARLHARRSRRSSPASSPARSCPIAPASSRNSTICKERTRAPRRRQLTRRRRTRRDRSLARRA